MVRECDGSVVRARSGLSGSVVRAHSGSVPVVRAHGGSAVRAHGGSVVRVRVRKSNKTWQVIT